jgi:hypothetical protein
MEDADWDSRTQHRWQVLPKKSENSFVVLSKKSRKESCCCYHAKEIANNSSVGLWRKKNSSVAEKQIGGKANQTIHA